MKIKDLLYLLSLGNEDGEVIVVDENGAKAKVDDVVFINNYNDAMLTTKDWGEGI